MNINHQPNIVGCGSGEGKGFAYGALESLRDRLMPYHS